MNNRLLKTFCATWLGASLAACGSTQGEETPAGPAKEADVQSALARFQEARVVGSVDGEPFAIEGQLGKVPQLSALRARDNAGAEVREALGDIAPVFRLSEGDLLFRRASVDAQGHRHLRFQQLQDGLPVVGGELLVHVNQQRHHHAGHPQARRGRRRHGRCARGHELRAAGRHLQLLPDALRPRLV